VYKKGLLVISMAFICFTVFLAGCQSSSNHQENENNETENNQNVEENNAQNVEIEAVETDAKPVVTMTMEDDKSVEIELYPEVAPNTVNNFITLIEDDFYDGLIFHRVIKDFMIQGGDPDGNGTGGPGYGIPGEFANNGYNNDLQHEPGVLSMARSQDPDSAGSQFFIVTGDASHLDGDYAGFGKVIDGMDVVDEIAEVETGANDLPKEEQIIKSMTVDLDGYEPKDLVKK